MCKKRNVTGKKDVKNQESKVPQTDSGIKMDTSPDNSQSNSNDSIDEKMKKQIKHNETLNIYANRYLPLYVVATILWILFFLIFGQDNNILSWQNYVCFMLLLGVIHVWKYTLLKFNQSRDDLNALFDISIDKDSHIKYMEILADYDDLRSASPFKKSSDKTRARIKRLYLGLWSFISIIIIVCVGFLHLYGIGDFSISCFAILSWFIIFILLIYGMILNYQSYYASMTFCYFTRQIANSQDLKCDSENPWNSTYLRQLIKIASRSSMSFFAVSTMYMAVMAISFLTTGRPADGSMRFFIMLVVLSTFLCAFSFILFTLLPKLFLNRRFRNWKFEKVRNLRDNNPVDSEKIEKIWSSKLPYVRMETVSGCLAMAINLGTLIVSIVALGIK